MDIESKKVAQSEIVGPTYSKMTCTVCKEISMFGDPCKKCRLKE